MKIVIISDNHGDADIIEKVRSRHKDVGMFLHLGDSCLPDFVLQGFICVKGNCDFGFDVPRIRNITTKYGLLHLEHGDSHFGISDDKVRYTNALVFLYGHTHIPEVKLIDQKYFLINPGSTSRPRGKSEFGSYALLELLENEVNVTLYEFSGIEYTYHFVCKDGLYSLEKYNESSFV